MHTPRAVLFLPFSVDKSVSIFFLYFFVFQLNWEVSKLALREAQKPKSDKRAQIQRNSRLYFFLSLIILGPQTEARSSGFLCLNWCIKRMYLTEDSEISSAGGFSQIIDRLALVHSFVVLLHR